MFAQMPALVLGAIATATVATTTFWNQWSVSGPTSKLVMGPIWTWRSLFSECVQYKTGQSQCLGMNSMFLMAGFRIAIRGFMISAIILSALSSIAVLIGSECTKILEDERDKKRKIMLASGVGYLLSGILTFASVTWWTYRVYNAFFRLETRDNLIQWEIGGTVYLGFITSFICVLAFFACICRPGPRKKEDINEKIQTYFYKSKPYETKASADDYLTKRLLESYKSRNSGNSYSKSRHSSRDKKSSSRRKRKNQSRKSNHKKSSSSSSTGDIYVHSEYV